MNLSAVPTLGDFVSSSLLLPALSDSERAALQNLKWEERISDERVRRYADCYSGSKIFDMGVLRNQHAAYAEQFLELEVGEAGDPDSFVSDNVQNHWAHIEENLFLLRIEDASFALRDSGVDLHELDDAVRTKNDVVLSRVCKSWNERRDRRPAFATTEIAVEDVLDAAGDDWPHALRNTLGLGHISPASGNPPTHVLLLKYTVGEVMREKLAGAAGVAIPTVLDGRINPFFFPTPSATDGSQAAQYEVGRAVNLSEVINQSEYSMGLELIHSYVAYKPEHIARIGVVSQPFACKFGAIRGFHLDWLRLLTERDDFAIL